MRLWSGERDVMPYWIGETYYTREDIDRERKELEETRKNWERRARVERLFGGERSWPVRLWNAVADSFTLTPKPPLKRQACHETRVSMPLRFKVHSRKDRLIVPGAPPSVAAPMPTPNDPAEWEITTQDVEDLRAEAARLPAEIRALQSRLALVRRKLDAVEYLLANKAKREAADAALPSPPSPG